jgi:catechol 2,3-dioxygenase-like lactoylglutathione lyase family enzyme
VSDPFKTAGPGRFYGGDMAPRIDVIGIVVADMAASLSFYRRLGLAVPDGADGEAHVEVPLPGGLRLLLDTVENVHSFDPEWSAPVGSARMGLAFACDTPAEVDKTYADLVGAGHAGAKEPWDAPWGMRYAVVHDPDGNGIDLFADLP